MNKTMALYLKRKKIGFVIDVKSRRVCAILTGHVEKYEGKLHHVSELQLASHDEKTYVDTNTKTLYLDGLALSDLMTCIFNRREWKNWRQFDLALQGMFGGGNGDKLTDYPTSAMAAVLGTSAPGELGYFARCMIDQHPDAFAVPAPGVLEIHFD